jgi:hypothetical protein
MKTTLDTTTTLGVLARTNDLAKARKLALHAILRSSREAGSLEAFRTHLDSILSDLEVLEQEVFSKS